ncbi:MAG TPA: DUF3341 domain-containing protein [Verrucomicrobiota bacterium]|nr:DUF3341 domain-containing protein [Verrucomicrobiota bacterium]HNU50532.1 DUF3341 domain-containing protein [Verrucomicrobiota bacterium]
MLETGDLQAPRRSREAPGQPDASRGYGLLAEFDTPAALLRAAEAARDAGCRRWDVFTPCPVPGMDQAMGLRNSKVGWFAFVGGLAGCALGLVMVWYMNAHDYPLLVGGKPMFSPFAAFPVVFELTVLLGAFGALAGLLCQSRLPEWYHPLLAHPRFARATQDKFFLLIECADDRYRGVETWRWLETLGCSRIEQIGH